MAEIRVLDKHTAELIAAARSSNGPASVAKELLENAIDAGATQITLSAVRGGIQQLQIVDNGSGIEAEYIDKAFIQPMPPARSATAEDLGHIHTLGLPRRGTCLHCQRCPRRGADPHRGRRVRLLLPAIEGGEERGMEPGARPVGTTITVSDLFYNTARPHEVFEKGRQRGHVCG